LYVATFTATARGTSTFKTDPADVLPLHETATNFPEKAIPYPRIDYGFASIDIVEAPKLVQIELVPTSVNGSPLPNNQIQAGSEFLVSAYVRDIRTDIADQFKGVFSAYLDVFYPQTLVTPVASTTSPFGYTINFASPFTEGQKANFVTTSGLIDEVGAFRSSAPSQPNQPNAQLLFTTRFRALQPAGGLGSVVFTADPADLQPVNEVSVIRSGSGQVPDPGLAVPTAQVLYVSTPVITVVGTGAGEAEFTNPMNPLDVNDDGWVTPTDALYVMNFLNVNGPLDLRTLSEGAAEGEATDIYYYDTNGDKVISAQDVLPVINHLNMVANTGSQAGQAEGEAAWTPVASEIAALAVDPPAVAAMLELVDAPTARAVLTKSDSLAILPEVDSSATPDAYFPIDEQEEGEALLEMASWMADDVLEDIAGAWQDPSALELLELIA
jgi:hypothetical protein